MQKFDARSPLSYIAPSVIFGVFSALEGYTPTSIYPLMYTAKMCAVTASLYVFRATLRDIVPSWRVLLPAILVGLAVFVEWIRLDQWVPYPHMSGGRVGFDPFASFENATARTAFIGVRLYGLILMVPVMEELFLRSFFLRYIVNTDFASVRIGSVSWMAFWAVAGLTAISHPEWLAAIIASVAYTLLLYRTKSLFATVVAHAVTNGALAWYVLTTHSWQYW